MLLSLVAAMPLLLIGCTASWQAPVESRTNRPYSAPPIQAVRDRDNYQVKPGDTLYGIAWSAGVDYRLLAAWNRLSPPYRIYAGQRLRLKPPPARQAQPGLASTSPGTASSRPVPPRPAGPQRPRPEPPAAASPSTPPAPRPVPTPPRKTETRPPAGPQELRWIWPTDGPLLARFDAAAPLGRGIKVGGRRGQSIRAAERGKVVYSGSGLIGYGRLIIVKHNDKFLSAYGHNEDIRVAEGDQVTKGQEIATMGVANDGKPLLHFEIRRDGKPVDPTGYLPKR
jgi:lipoprotein NlpD